MTSETEPRAARPRPIGRTSGEVEASVTAAPSLLDGDSTRREPRCLRPDSRSGLLQVLAQVVEDEVVDHLARADLAQARMLAFRLPARLGDAAQRAGRLPDAAADRRGRLDRAGPGQLLDRGQAARVIQAAPELQP